MMADEDESRDRKASRPSWRVALRIAAVTSLNTGVLAPFVYASMGTSLLSLGFGASDKGISAGDCWVFAPGAALLGGWLCYHLARQRLTWRLRLVHGAAIGAIGAGFNLPLAILFYNGPGSIVEMLASLGTGLLFSPVWIIFGAPLSVPSGAILGLWVGTLCQVQVRGFGHDDP
jgi:hypothetical protein